MRPATCCRWGQRQVQAGFTQPAWGVSVVSTPQACSHWRLSQPALADATPPLAGIATS